MCLRKGQSINKEEESNGRRKNEHSVDADDKTKLASYLSFYPLMEMKCRTAPNTSFVAAPSDHHQSWGRTRAAKISRPTTKKSWCDLNWVTQAKQLFFSTQRAQPVRTEHGDKTLHKGGTIIKMARADSKHEGNS